MTVTLPNHRVDQRVHPARLFISPGAAWRAVAIAILLALLPVVTAGAQESTPAATPAIEPTPEMPRLELELEELNDSGITGTVTLYDAGDDETIVEFDVEGSGGNHPAHIHRGTCGDLDPEPYKNLENVDAQGKSTTVVDVALDDLLAGDYAIDMHLAPDELGTLIACADIEGEPETPGEASPAASPEATPTEAVGGTIATETPAEPGVAVTETPVSGATDGTSGAAPSQITEQGGQSATTPPVPVGGDGTAGISGKGEPVNTSTLPQQAGVGAALDWPEGPTLTAMLASLGAAILLGTCGWFVRRGEQHTTPTPSRWNRLGI